MNDQKITLDLNLVDAILSYLGTRPFNEVANLIIAIKQQADPQVIKEEKAE